MTFRRALRCLVTPLAAAIVLAAPGTASAAVLPAPVAAGTSGANISLSGSDRHVMLRWVARQTGTLRALHMRIEAGGSACRSDHPGYGHGTGGSWHVTTHPVLPDGRPNTDVTLSTEDLRPCTDGPSMVDVRAGVVKVPMDLPVTKGAEFATVVRNTDPLPGTNFTSTNFLYSRDGLAGANGRNERNPSATDVYYGLDPRELVGFSTDGGRNWALPGTSARQHDKGYLPTYIQEFDDGDLKGQPYYYTAAPTTGDRTMVFRNIKDRWMIRALGVFTPAAGKGTLTLSVDGAERARVPVSGHGMLRRAISPVIVKPGQTVKVTSSGLTVHNVVADAAWGRLLGMDQGKTGWAVDGAPNFSHAAPVYALPASDSADASGRVWLKKTKAKKKRLRKRSRSTRS